jgi:hypothetical protein
MDERSTWAASTNHGGQSNSAHRSPTPRAEHILNQLAFSNKLKGVISRSHCVGINSLFLFLGNKAVKYVTREFQCFLRKT